MTQRPDVDVSDDSCALAPGTELCVSEPDSVIAILTTLSGAHSGNSHHLLLLTSSFRCPARGSGGDDPQKRTNGAPVTANRGGPQWCPGAAGARWAGVRARAGAHSEGDRINFLGSLPRTNERSMQH